MKSKQPTVQEIALRFCIDDIAKDDEKESLDEMLYYAGSEDIRKQYLELCKAQEKVRKRLEKYAKGK